MNINSKGAKILVMGVGGAGNNAINRMIEAGLESAEFIAINTDVQVLATSKTKPENRLQIGEKLTNGLGAGANPEEGEKAAIESIEAIKDILQGVDLLFITAGMGGGTGTGAAPIIAAEAKKLKILTIAIVTKPFRFEGRRRMENAEGGIAKLREIVDTLLIVPNDKILQLVPKNTSMVDAFKKADDVLRIGIQGIADLIAKPALINLDFADVRTIIKNTGLAHMGIGECEGDNRVIEAVREAVRSPLLETDIEGATGVILNFVGGNLTINEIDDACTLVRDVVDESANIIFGADPDPSLGNKVRVTVIATGFVNKSVKNLNISEIDKTKPFKEEKSNYNMPSSLPSFNPSYPRPSYNEPYKTASNNTENKNIGANNANYENRNFNSDVRIDRNFNEIKNDRNSNDNRFERNYKTETKYGDYSPKTDNDFNRNNTDYSNNYRNDYNKNTPNEPNYSGNRNKPENEISIPKGTIGTGEKKVPSFLRQLIKSKNSDNK